MSNVANSAYRSFSICFSKQMREIGFQILPRTRYVKRSNDACILVELQKELRPRDGGVTFFTVNIGISIDQLREEMRPENEVGPISESLDIDNCNWMQRLGALVGEKPDTWWTIRDETDAQTQCNELTEKFTLIAWPKIEEMTSVDSMLRSWADGRAPGLTEYQRLSYTARLLVGLGRHGEAIAAIDSLEQKSVGKTWEAKAKLDVNEYRGLIHR